MVLPTMTERTIQPGDLLRFQFLQDAKLSPDGRQIPYCVSHIDAARDEEWAAVWLTDLETGEKRKLTAGLALDTHAAWSPDGKQLAFFSTRSGIRQLYAISVHGGEPRQLTDLAQGLGRGPAWSPDGQYIAFSARATSAPVFPVKPYRVTRHVYRLDGSGYLHVAAPDLFVVPASGGACAQPDPGRSLQLLSQLAPSGLLIASEILFTTACYPDSYRWFAALRAVNLNGTVRDVVKEWGCATNPPSAAWTPDGESALHLSATRLTRQSRAISISGSSTGRAEHRNAAPLESSITWRGSFSPICRS